MATVWMLKAGTSECFTGGGMGVLAAKLSLSSKPVEGGYSLMPLRAPITFNESLLPLFPRKSKLINRTVIVLSDLAGLVSPKKNISSFISSSFHAGHKYSLPLGLPPAPGKK
jgi:hypothetical protein